jgi:glycosyltransferase involved in cell wall biosynthesis
MMTNPPRIAVVYTHFPHYRAAVFAALTASAAYDYDFYYDPAGIETSIVSGEGGTNHYPLAVRRWRALMWQGGALRLALSGPADGFIFLGNPYILSTWIAAMLARIRGKPVFFWTHGWLRRETGMKGRLRRCFYRLADGLMVYGTRAREIGIAAGFSPDRIHVINNSLDYAVQKQAREAVESGTAEPPGADEALPDTPYFLCVTRLVPIVELDQAIEAMALLPRRAALVVVGDGPEFDTLLARAEKLGVNVRFLGAIYDEMRLARLFLGARAVVSPGKVGLLAMHAMAYGAPVITHDDLDQQMPEVEAIEPSVTGAFFRRGDVADLARQMARFLDTDPDMSSVETIRYAAISRIEREYTPQVQVARITAALDTMFRSEG